MAITPSNDDYFLLLGLTGQDPQYIASVNDRIKEENGGTPERTRAEWKALIKGGGGLSHYINPLIVHDLSQRGELLDYVDYGWYFWIRTKNGLYSDSDGLGRPNGKDAEGNRVTPSRDAYSPCWICARLLDYYRSDAQDAPYAPANDERYVAVFEMQDLRFSDDSIVKGNDGWWFSEPELMYIPLNKDRKTAEAQGYQSSELYVRSQYCDAIEGYHVDAGGRLPEGWGVKRGNAFSPYPAGTAYAIPGRFEWSNLTHLAYNEALSNYGYLATRNDVPRPMTEAELAQYQHWYEHGDTDYPIISTEADYWEKSIKQFKQKCQKDYPVRCLSFTVGYLDYLDSWIEHYRERQEQYAVERTISKKNKLVNEAFPVPVVCADCGRYERMYAYSDYQPVYLTYGGCNRYDGGDLYVYPDELGYSNVLLTYGSIERNLCFYVPQALERQLIFYRRGGNRDVSGYDFQACEPTGPLIHMGYDNPIWMDEINRQLIANIYVPIIEDVGCVNRIFYSDSVYRNQCSHDWSNAQGFRIAPFDMATWEREDYAFRGKFRHPYYFGFDYTYYTCNEGMCVVPQRLFYDYLNVTTAPSAYALASAPVRGFVPHRMLPETTFVNVSYKLANALCGDPDWTDIAASYADYNDWRIHCFVQEDTVYVGSSQREYRIRKEKIDDVGDYTVGNTVSAESGNLSWFGIAVKSFAPVGINEYSVAFEEGRKYVRSMLEYWLMAHNTPLGSNISNEELLWNHLQCVHAHNQLEYTFAVDWYRNTVYSAFERVMGATSAAIVSFNGTTPCNICSVIASDGYTSANLDKPKPVYYRYSKEVFEAYGKTSPYATATYHYTGSRTNTSVDIMYRVRRFYPDVYNTTWHGFSTYTATGNATLSGKYYDRTDHTPVWIVNSKYKNASSLLYMNVYGIYEMICSDEYKGSAIRGWLRSVQEHWNVEFLQRYSDSLSMYSYAPDLMDILPGNLLDSMLRMYVYSGHSQDADNKDGDMLFLPSYSNKFTLSEMKKAHGNTQAAEFSTEGRRFAFPGSRDCLLRTANPSTFAVQGCCIRPDLGKPIGASVLDDNGGIRPSTSMDLLKQEHLYGTTKCNRLSPCFCL